MEGEGGGGVSKRKLKVTAYRSAHRLLRIANRKARKERDGLVAMAMMSQEDPPDEDAEEKKEAERCERMEKNKEWRQMREMQRWESCGLDPPLDPKVEKEKNRKIARKFEKQLCSELLCSNCRSGLLTEVWECLEGHPTCGECFDRENIGKDIHVNEKRDQNSNGNKSRKSSSTLSTQSLDSLKESFSASSIATLCSIETIKSLRESLADIAEGEEDSKSWAKYKVNEIDFFLDTLEVRKDAINFYNDYNNAFKSIFYNPDIEGLSLNGDDDHENIEDNEYKDEKTERVINYIERLRNQGSIASLRETLIDVIETDDDEIDPSWAKFRLEEIDFFLNTLDIRKDAITYYGDYHNGFRSIFGHYAFDDEDGDIELLLEETNEENNAEKTDNKPRKSKITKCSQCAKFICKRNFQVEKIAKIFLQVDQ